MTTKAIIQLLFFALVFATFTAHGAWGEDCCDEKERFKHKCNANVKRDQNYERPSKFCCDIVRSVDMACVHHRTISSEEKELSVQKIACLSMACNNSVRVGKKYGGNYNYI